MVTKKIVFLSENYFDLAAAYPELGPILALGPRVIAFAGDYVYEIVLDDNTGETGSEVSMPTQTALPEKPAADKPVVIAPEPTQKAAQATSKEEQPGSVNRCLRGLLPLPLAMVAVMVWISSKPRWEK